MSITKSQIISLYRNLIREAKKFPAYNFRMYSLRRIRDGFRENRTLSDSKEIKNKFDYGQQNLEILKRQVIINQMYTTRPSIMELVEKRKKNKALVKSSKHNKTTNK